MNRRTFDAVLSEHRRALLSLLLTVILLGALAAAAVPSRAVETTLTGPDEVDRNDRMTVTATVDLEDGERVPIEAFQFTLSPSDTPTDEALTVTFAPDGTVLDVTPERGTINRGDVRIRKFVKSLTITPVDNSASYGYGYRAGYDEQAGATKDYGYGYGFGYGNAEMPEFEYEISFDATALDRDTFIGQLAVDTGDDTSFASDEFQFEVTRPSNGHEDDWDEWNKDRRDWDDWHDRHDWHDWDKWNKDRHDWDNRNSWDDDRYDRNDRHDGGENQNDRNDDQRNWDDDRKDRNDRNDARHHWFGNWFGNRHFWWASEGGTVR